MKQTYEYMHIITACDSICIDDISKCNIKAFKYIHINYSLEEKDLC